MKHSNLNITHTTSRLAFSLRMDTQRPWWRDLDLDGKPLYRIGNICDTCEVMFEKQTDANLPIAPSELSALLRSGLDDIHPDIVATIAPILPKGSYYFSLLNVQPALIKFRGPEYYLWENSQPARTPDEWLPQSEPMVPWWFAEPDRSPGLQQGALYEAVLPLVEAGKLDRSTIDTYTAGIQNNLKPTALALSVVDVRIVSGRAFDWRLIHFLLDGHHKMMAASRAGIPITLLSFLNIDESFAARDWIDRSIQVRYQT